MSTVYRTDDPRQAAVNDLPRVILCLVAPRLEHSTLGVRAEQLNHSVTAAPIKQSRDKDIWLVVKYANIQTHIDIR
ncbi:unnamed protein product [Didymodactylos carnosus]|uniref:Uncharacterized protein n=1 Tax=Didymodactylos carnosus TaxID=1234261 RepID=A0A815CJN1_9BILA|nr:unnamed protein product [Didymodactylos carnosus]CAF1284577.1 unnamed protein product [Didymodactylos carnosus]CAF4032244.1 unnamed protein product [Didymodactylos carnosus]CAF4083111.1 unnamed protein product [Didymodactylos carnosus]